MSTHGKSYNKLLIEEEVSIVGKYEDCQNKKIKKLWISEFGLEKNNIYMLENFIAMIKNV